MSTPTSSKPKRITYSDDDCHKLVDIIINYSSVIESKATDAVTWKEKDVAWNKIAQQFNCGSVVPRTPKQLREKYDNLKKDVRKHFSKERQETYVTGGGKNLAKIRTILKLLYEKIASIIQLSVYGMEPHPADSDWKQNEDLASKNEELLGNDNRDVDVKIIEEETAEPALDSTPITENGDITHVNEQDWSTYTPAMLRSKKHPALQSKECRAAILKKSGGLSESKPSTSAKLYQDLAKAKLELVLLKTKLIDQESTQGTELQQLRLRKEEELYDAKIKGHDLKNQKLQLENEKLELEIAAIKNKM